MNLTELVVDKKTTHWNRLDICDAYHYFALVHDTFGRVGERLKFREHNNLDCNETGMWCYGGIMLQLQYRIKYSTQEFGWSCLTSNAQEIYLELCKRFSKEPIITGDVNRSLV